MFLLDLMWMGLMNRVLMILPTSFHVIPFHLDLILVNKLQHPLYSITPISFNTQYRTPNQSPSLPARLTLLNLKSQYRHPSPPFYPKASLIMFPNPCSGQIVIVYTYPSYKFVNVSSCGSSVVWYITRGNTFVE